MLALSLSFLKSHPTRYRYRASDSFGLIVLPATTANGFHLHGLI
jgi:hypothetical protein